MRLPSFFLEEPTGLTNEAVKKAADRLANALLEKIPRRVLLVPPDNTRSNSGAGMLTNLLYSKIAPRAVCDILPALGSHRPMCGEELAGFFGGDIPAERFLIHHWRKDIVEIGLIPADVMAELSEGRINEAVPVEINRILAEGGYDEIISIGQVVPHEVAGMANYSKNMLVGCGGPKTINTSHLLSVFAGTEKWIGRDYSPVRRMFDYAQDRFLCKLPITYLLTVTTPAKSGRAESAVLNGLYAGGGRLFFEKAVALSQRLNITRTGKAVEECVVFLSPEEFRSAWLGNKAVYRTRLALAAGAKLIILAPGFERFGEDEANDTLIRRYGYSGRDKLLALYDTESALRENQGALAHMIHGSSDGQFTVMYCTPPAYADDVRGVGYEWGDITEYAAKYAGLADGWNPSGVYYINNPALGLWTV